MSQTCTLSSPLIPIKLGIINSGMYVRGEVESYQVLQITREKHKHNCTHANATFAQLDRKRGFTAKRKSDMALNFGLLQAVAT